MKKLKVNLENEKQFLTREEMKNIVGGRGCTCAGIPVVVPDSDKRTCTQICKEAQGT